MSGKEAQLTQLLQPTVEAMGYVLWGIELISPGKRSTLRLYIEADAGISVDDCAAVSHQVSGVLDVEDPISSGYTLEVSSPGVDRLLFSPEHYSPYAGEMIDVRLRLPVEGRRRYKGILLAANNETVVMVVDDQEFELNKKQKPKNKLNNKLSVMFQMFKVS